jgi:shikimate dehydrogenase
MNISGHTTPFAVLGHPIGHTLSPIMHNSSLSALGMDAIYLAFDAPPDRLMAILHGMRDMGFKGVNLTVPLKEVAFRGVDSLDASAKLSGSVNTIEFLEDGTLRGHSTDGHGFVTAVKESFGVGVADQTVFVLGSGGAGRAVAITCADEGARRIVVSDIDAARADKVVEEIAALCPDVAVSSTGTDVAAWAAAAGEADLVIQATPVGMRQDDTPLLSREAFGKGQMVFDLIYMYPETGIMSEALAAGAKVANGLGMLLHQGARSFEIWTGEAPDVDAMRGALETAVYKSDRA